MERYEKTYVDVIARMQSDGSIMPIKIIWEDGSVYDIDRVKAVRQAPAVHVGGAGLRYQCQINSRDRYLYLEDYPKQRWFVERQRYS